eukprot:6684774-Lingulodinium_polyedra.AAC.1
MCIRDRRRPLLGPALRPPAPTGLHKAHRAPLSGAPAQRMELCTINASPKNGHLLLFPTGDTRVPRGATR